jgi:hypothetical protein
VRFLVTISICVCLTLASLSESVTILSFFANRSFIAQNLCEKKDQPGNHCQGCCFLKKQLGNEKKSDGTPPLRNLNESETLQTLPPDSPADLHSPRTGRFYLTTQNSVPPLPSGKEIDHPPESAFL